MFQKITDQGSRFFVGGLFIFSGLIKLNDPVGTQIKLQEYFEVFADDFGSFFHVFVPYALEIGMLLIVLELVLGIAVLVYYRMSLTTIVLLLMMVFFTFLTFYSAYFNKVTDCGCFGDAIKLTPWQSFTKDVVLLFPVLHLFWYRKKYEPVLYTKEGHVLMGVFTAVFIFLGVYAIQHLPFIDFRAYRIGNNIAEQMQPEEQPIIEYIFEKEGKEVASQKFLPTTEGYTYKRSRLLNEDKTVAKITDYAVTDVDGNDVTEQTFSGTKLIIVIGDVNKAATDNLGAIRELMKKLEGKTEIMIFTSTTAEQFEAFRHEHQLAAPYYFVDATVLKTIIRSNPGITLWRNGTVLGMWHHNDTPQAEDVLLLIK
jgi:uncharacterized membrane protein YphA (DoxX/SURF4 family)